MLYRNTATKSQRPALGSFNDTFLTAYIIRWWIVGNSHALFRCGIIYATQTQSSKQNPKLKLQNGVGTELPCLRCRKT